MGDFLSRKRWVVSKCDKDRAATIAENCGIEPFAAYLLCARGMTDEFEIESFLFDTDLIDPFTLPDMDKACERINQALDNGEKITVFGDYDADGVTSTALLYSFLSSIGGNVDYYIPAGALIDCDGMNPDGTYINPVYQKETHYGNYPFPNNGGANSGVGSDLWIGGTNQYTDASYVKVKHITLGYSFNKKLLKKMGMQKLRLYCTVTNPFVFTDYKGFDPEWANSSLKNDGPSTVTWQFGASIKL